MSWRADLPCIRQIQPAFLRFKTERLLGNFRLHHHHQVTRGSSCLTLHNKTLSQGARLRQPPSSPAQANRSSRKEGDDLQ